jgi:cysteine desulfurase
VGSSIALADAMAHADVRADEMRSLATRLLEGLSELDGWHLIGPTTDRLPGLVTLEFPGVEGEAAMINLDLEGIAVSTGSTCALGGTDPSPTLVAMGFSRRRAASTLRFSVGRHNTDADIDRAAATVAQVVSRLRDLARR